jgi:hypothetical protein
MCERDQSFPWANELFRDPFASTGYYGPPNGYNDGYYCDHHYTRGSFVECRASILCKIHEKKETVFLMYVFLVLQMHHIQMRHICILLHLRMIFTTRQ